MQLQARIIGVFLSLVVLSCSGNNSGLRTPSKESSESDGKHVDGSDSSPLDNSFTASNSEKVSVPVPTAGAYLVKVQSHCVNDTANLCNKVRLSATVKVGDADPVRFARDTLSGLGIRSSKWEFVNLPSSTTCDVVGDGKDVSPLCEREGGESLAAAEDAIQATLKLELNQGLNGGSPAEGVSPKIEPLRTGVHGNFKLLDLSSGFAPTGKIAEIDRSVKTGLQLFSQIWQDLVSGLYVTNILYDGTGFVDWYDAEELCQRLASRDGWRLPTKEELCFVGDNYNSCNSGFFIRGINNVQFEGGGWGGRVWTSPPIAVDVRKAWTVSFSAGNSSAAFREEAAYHVICVRDH